MYCKRSSCFFKRINTIMNILWGRVFCKSVHHVHERLVDLEEGISFPRLELQRVVCHQMGAGNQTWVSYKSNKCSQPFLQPQTVLLWEIFPMAVVRTEWLMQYCETCLRLYESLGRRPWQCFFQDMLQLVQPLVSLLPPNAIIFLPSPSASTAHGCQVPSCVFILCIVLWVKL